MSKPHPGPPWWGLLSVNVTFDRMKRAQQRIIGMFDAVCYEAQPMRYFLAAVLFCSLAPAATSRDRSPVGCAKKLVIPLFEAAILNKKGTADAMSVETLEKVLAPHYAIIRTTRVTSREVLEGGLDDYQALIIPPGSAELFASELGSSGLELVRSFAANGGVVLAVATGISLVVGDKGLDLLPAVRAVPNPISDAEISVTLTKKGEKLLNFARDEYHYISAAGPVFQVAPKAKVNVLAKQKAGGHPVVLRAGYENGSVVLFSPVPEQSTRECEFFTNVLVDELLSAK